MITTPTPSVIRGELHARVPALSLWAACARWPAIAMPVLLGQTPLAPTGLSDAWPDGDVAVDSVTAYGV